MAEYSKRKKFFEDLDAVLFRAEEVDMACEFREMFAPLLALQAEVEKGPVCPACETVMRVVSGDSWNHYGPSWWWDCECIKKPEGR